VAQGRNTGGSRYALGLFVLLLVLMGQIWGIGVLLLTRQTETLLLVSIGASLLWFWCFWIFLLRRRRAGLILTTIGLVFSMVMNGFGLLDMLDRSGLLLAG
jgi:hypothetical protein